jgi:nitrous oxidase accessory protein NosD
MIKSQAFYRDLDPGRHLWRVPATALVVNSMAGQVLQDARKRQPRIPYTWKPDTLNP